MTLYQRCRDQGEGRCRSIRSPVKRTVRVFRDRLIARSKASDCLDLKASYTEQVRAPPEISSSSRPDESWMPLRSAVNPGALFSPSASSHLATDCAAQGGKVCIMLVTLLQDDLGVRVFSKCRRWPCAGADRVQIEQTTKQPATLAATRSKAGRAMTCFANAERADKVVR